VLGTAVREPRYTIHDGFRMPLGFPVEGLVSGLRYRPTPSDVFIATYPKCGTTWTQYMMYLLLNHGQPLPADRSLNDVFPHLEEVGEAVVKALPVPRLVKTHLPFERTPWSPTAKYVYVARNPFDCAVSFYHHTRGFVRHYDFADGTWEAFFECFLRGAVDFGDYFDNLLSWWATRSLPNVLFLTYEAMLTDPQEAALTLARFIGGAAERAAADQAVLARVVAHSSFDNMRVNQKRWSSERPADMPEFVRRGIVGDWTTLFSVSQGRRLAEKFRARTAGTGAESLWPKIVAAAAG
jgi:sulfotransferase